jgi:Cu-Zn family superoxide dismutase
MFGRTLAVIAGLAVAGCTTMGSDTETGSADATTSGATAVLRMADGKEVGRAVASQVGGSIRVSVDAMGVSPGPHGVHVHTIGRCDAPDFTTAGGHWNPTSMQHGAQNPAGPHSGDMPNLVVGPDGRGTLTFTLPSSTMAGLLDADGSAFMIHAGADDMKTDPAGNSGSRIACGVFAAS